MNVTAKTTTIVLKGARVLDPVEGLDQTADIRISDGVIEAIGPNLPAAETTVDCKGMIVTPGLIDGHVHVYEDVGFNGIDPDVPPKFATYDTLVATNVFAREDGVWRLIHHHAGPLFVHAAEPHARPDQLH